MSHCHNVLHVDRLPYFTIRRCISPYNLRYSPFHLPLTSLEQPLFLFHERSFWGAVPLDREYAGCQKVFYRLEFLVFCGQYESWTLELVRSHSNPPFDFFSQKDISCPMCVHSGIDSRASPFSLISISALFIITLVVLYVVLVQLLCSVLLVYSQFLVVYH